MVEGQDIYLRREIVFYNMGLFPRPDGMTDKEFDEYMWNLHEKIKLKIYIKNEFLDLKGYKSNLIPHHLRGIHPAYYDCLEYIPGPFLSPNGKYYKDIEEFYKETGQYPFLTKNGVCYGLYEALRKENYPL